MNQIYEFFYEKNKSVIIKTSEKERTAKMKLKNILLAVNNMEQSKTFYHDLFGLDVIADFGNNIILTEGLVLQERQKWNQLIGKISMQGNGDCELYFEERNFDSFLKKLESYPKPIEILNPVAQNSMRQRYLRIYDPDYHIIEIKES